MKRATDSLGRTWPRAKLDALLADREVRQAAEAVLEEGFGREDVFMPERVHLACHRRYRRPEPAELLFLLARRVVELLPPRSRKPRRRS